jgi:hypothetical protein
MNKCFKNNLSYKIKCPHQKTCPAGSAMIGQRQHQWAARIIKRGKIEIGFDIYIYFTFKLVFSIQK